MGHRCCNQRLQAGVHGCPTSVRGRESDSNAKGCESSPAIVGRSSSSNSKERSSVDSSALRDWVLGYLLPSAQEDGRLASNTQPQAAQCVHSSQTLSNAVPIGSVERGHQRQVGHVARPQGCVLTCPDSRTRSEVASVQGQRSGIRVQVPAVWPLHSSEGFHQGDSRAGGLYSGPGRPDLYVSGRLDNNVIKRARSVERHSKSKRDRRESGVYNKQTQVVLCPHTETPISGGDTPARYRASSSFGRSSSQSNQLCGIPSGCEGGPCDSVAQSIGLNGQHGGSNTVVSVPHASTAITPDVFLSTSVSRSSESSPGERLGQGGIEMVDEQGQSLTGNDIPCTSSSGCSNNRRLQHRLGGSRAIAKGQRHVVRGPEATAYQCPRTLGSGTVASGSVRSNERQDSVGPIGQHNSGSLHKQTGGDEVSLSLPSRPPVIDLGERSGDVLAGGSHPWRGEHSSRQSLSRDFNVCDRLVTVTDDCERSFSPIGGVVSRPVCDVSQSSTPGILHERERCAGVSAGRVLPQLVEFSGVCFSSNTSDTRGIEEGNSREMSHDSDSPMLAAASVVPGGIRSGSGGSTSFTSQSRSITNAGVTGQIPQGQRSTSDCMAVVSRGYQKKGFSRDVAKIIARGRRSSTNRVYSSRLSFYFEWCRRRKISPSTASIINIADFLKFKFDEGLQAATVKGYLSAIQAIHDGIEGVPSLFKCRPLKLLLDGMHNLRPPTRKIWPAWDLPSVLKFLEASPFEPMGSATVRDTAIKTAFLLAVASGRRGSEIHACAIGGYTVFSQAGVTLYFKKGFLAKNERINFQAKPVFIPKLERALRINCPVRALKWYLNKTKISRGDHQQIFISSKKPYGPVTKTTIANWIVNLISDAGALLTDVPASAHSTRHVATSWAFYNGITIAEIVNTVAWKTNSSFINTYLRDITPKTSFAQTVLGSSSKTH